LQLSLLVYSGIQALITGKTIGIGTMSVGANYITQTNNPIEFILVVLLLDFGFGFWLIKVGLSKKDMDE